MAGKPRAREKTFGDRITDREVLFYDHGLNELNTLT